jgi:hypothetical protein
MSYTKLFSSIVTSTIWAEDNTTRIVWITMLALANQHGEVQASIPGLARISAVSVADCELAIEKFLGPDPYSRTEDDEGRRIEKIDGGWSLLNHQKYREMASKDEAKLAAARRQQRFKQKQQRNATAVTVGNAPVTVGNAEVTQSRDIAEADTDVEADTKAFPGAAAVTAPDPPAARKPRPPEKRYDEWVKPLADLWHEKTGAWPEPLSFLRAFDPLRGHAPRDALVVGLRAYFTAEKPAFVCPDGFVKKWKLYVPKFEEPKPKVKEGPREETDRVQREAMEAAMREFPERFVRRATP